MYNPPAFAEHDRGQIVAFLHRAALGHLITASTPGDDGTGDEVGDGLNNGPSIQATALPFVVDQDLTRVRAHFAKANRHWRSINGSTGLLIVPGDDTYVSPRWYPSKAEHGRVVPTWNYELVHIHGTIEIHHDPAWKRTMVEDLTDQHEARISEADQRPAWMVSDAPSGFIDDQLKAIVGIEVTITNLEAKRKLSQNRAEADQYGVIDGLARSDHSVDHNLAAAMTRPSV